MSSSNLSRLNTGKEHRLEIAPKRDIPRALSKDILSKGSVKGSVNSLNSRPSSSWNLFRIFQSNDYSSDGSSRTHSNISLSKASSNSRSSLNSVGISRTSLTSPGGRLAIKAFSVSKTTHRHILGKVMVGCKKNEKQMFEIRRYTKDAVVNSKKVYALLQERFILEQLRSEHYVTTLRYAFQDESYAYLVYDLDDFPFTMAIFDTCLVKETLLKNLAGQLAYALNYLHENYIILNGLKLESIFIKNGNVLLKDFSNGIYTKKEKPRVKLSLQMPVPELVEGDECWYSIDWWCLGTILFRLAFGKHLIPADSSLEGIKLIFSALKLKLSIPHLAGLEIGARSDRNDFINALLVTDPTKRLGSASGGLGFEKGIKSQRWMTSMNWEDVRAQKLPLKLDYSKLSKKIRRESISSDQSNNPPSVELNMCETDPSYVQKMKDKISENFVQFSVDTMCPPMAFITTEYLKEKNA